MVVSFEAPEQSLRHVHSLLAQREPPTEIIVVDNHPDAVTAAHMRAKGLPVTLVSAGQNLGYPSACNLAARHARGDHLFFLNPDADADPECLGRLRGLMDSHPAAAIVGAQVLLADGEHVNAGDNPIHLSGLSWSGRWLQQREHGPPREIVAASGACCLVRRSAFEALDGFCEGFFLYHDDVDLAWRAWMDGWRVLFHPEAVVMHNYAPQKGSHKWMWMERNRLWCVLANYEARTLVALAPILVGCELAVLAYAARSGWLRDKLHAYRLLWRDRASLRTWRRRVQMRRRVADRELLPRFVATIDSPLLDGRLTRAASPWLERYKRLILTLLYGLGACRARSGGSPP
jgi:GT2 family glycosyltransferase